ncbi:hypothetical protein PTRA_b0227 [Pseudoalteromonas translucida KMM 520]|uniref:Thioredoxin domain-containing protein n=1 Tax=Pseudoalteromonas translucida KMM 520 TaxID=1315283 RepID=A0A0U2X280_9GAMM|nr:TlpA disulfide reductase family protein [Pseudoalteromonas translucida]ALS34744.1 hypothetical protein PTRA_b0227 [Pseudoalteromonas translucida KMM 520]
MLSISLGPFVIAISQLIILLGLGVFWGLTYLQTRKQPQQKAILDTVFKAFVVGFIVARLMFVLTMWDAYQENWWQLINISDGGFMPSYGWVAGALVLVLYARGKKAVLKTYFIAAIVALFTIMVPTFAASIYKAGVELPQSAVYNLRGKEVDLQSFKGKPVVINFWASWCPPCRKEMPVLQAAQKNNPNIAFVFVNQGEDLFTVQKFINAEQLDLQNVFFDQNSNVSRESGAAGLPTTLFYSSDGKLVTSHMGELSHASLRYYMQAINQQSAQ